MLTVPAARDLVFETAMILLSNFGEVENLQYKGHKNRGTFKIDERYVLILKSFRNLKRISLL